MNETIIVGGRDVSLEALRQHLVYAGLIEGLPTGTMNRRHIQAVTEEARAMANGGRVHLIEPAQKPIPYEGRYPFGVPMALPGVAVIARLHSSRPARNRDADASTLVVVWFQDELALPVAPEVKARLLALRWELLADDYEM